VFRRLQREQEPVPGPERPPEAEPERRASAAPGSMLALQQTVGNAVAARMMADLRADAPSLMFPKADVESVEVGLFAGEPVSAEGHGEAPPLQEPPTNEFGEYDGVLESDHKACVFVDGGRVGEAAVYFTGGGGNGGRGLQGLGDIALVAPVYEGADPASAGDQATAWIKPGTGTATVTRSFRGVLAGANGTWYFTAAARTRVDTHERLHIAASRAVHDLHIVPLERRIAAHTGQPNARASGATRADAIAALQRYIDWNTAVADFRTEDTRQNTPGPPLGPVDAADLARPDFIVDYGARAVGTANFAHYVDVPPGPGPAAAPAAPGAAAGAGAGP
jgi:hypothetical protein